MPANAFLFQDGWLLDSIPADSETRNIHKLNNKYTIKIPHFNLCHNIIRCLSTVTDIRH